MFQDNVLKGIAHPFDDSEDCEPKNWNKGRKQNYETGYETFYITERDR